MSGAFGTVSLADYARFIEIHTRHHCKQMPAALFAGMFGFTKKDFFDLGASRTEVEAAPSVKF